MKNLLFAAILLASIVNVATGQVLFKEDFEGVNPLSKASGIENCGLSYALQFVTNGTTKAARFEIRKWQPLVGSAKKVRSEVTVIRGEDKERWYSYSIYLPEKGMEYDATRECITQWYEDGSDETTIRIEKEKVYLEVCPPQGSSKLIKYDLFSSNSGSLSTFTTAPKNKWYTFTFHFIQSKSSDGLIEVWRDGLKVHTIKGRNMHLKYPKWKLGLYKASFLDKSSKMDYRVIYFDNLIVSKNKVN